MKLSTDDITILGIEPVWSAQTVETLSPGENLLWIHTRRHRMVGMAPDDKRLVKKVRIESISNGIIKTDFGKYSVENGRNIFYACGCKKFCDCYGRLFVLKDTQ